MTLKAIDICCGVGGSTLGFRSAGFDVILGIDIDQTALQSYAANFPDIETWRMDILGLEAADLPEADVILGSTPCTEFSIANVNRSFDMALTDHFLQLVDDYKPKYWVLENVPPIAAFLKKRRRPHNVLLCADYGVPQKRRRCFGGNYPYPTPTHAEHSGPTLTGTFLKRWVNFGQIKHPEGGKILSKKAIAGAFRRANERSQKGIHFGLQFIDDFDVVPTLLATEWHGLRSSSPVIYDNGVLRRMSWRECVRVQSFPDDHIFRGTQVQRFRQLGDAVPPLMAGR